MTRNKAYYTAKELVGLPGLPTTESGVIRKAKSDSWPSRPRQGKGGGREYPLTALPQATRDHLLAHKVSLIAPAETTTALVATESQPLQSLAELKSWQTRTMDARLAIIRYVEESAKAVGISAAIGAIVKQAQSDDLPEQIRELIRSANKRSGQDSGKRTLSEATIYRWIREYKAAGKNYTALAPKAVEKEAVPPWAPAFLKAYRVPQKISVAAAIEDMELPAGIPYPSEAQAYRFLSKMSRLDVQRGRKSPQELRSQRGYCDRDTSKFYPGDICLCDGHSFKAYIAHPVHKRPFHPEVCAVIDAVTRTVIGWSAGLAESAQTVADAVRHAVTTNEQKPEGCIPAIFYTDPGAGNKASVNAHDFTGLYARLGITWKTGIPGNSQARGLVERMQGTLWVKAAKKLPTFTGGDMDKKVRRKVYLLLDAEVKKAKKEDRLPSSELLMSWAEFLDFCQSVVDSYNRRPHSALPRISDPQTGLRRHMCPLEYWSHFLAQGWTPTLPTADELDHLFRPQLQAKTIRGGVTVFGNKYTNKELEHYHGEILNVAYDIHDASLVWVRDQEERLICTAKFEGNKRDFYPVPVVEKARNDRMRRRLKTKQLQIEEIELEAKGVIETTAPERIELPAEVIDFEARQQQKQIALAPSRKFFDSIDDLHDDIRERQGHGQASDYEIQWADDRDRSLSSGKRVGLYRDDPECAGRFGQALAK